MNKTNKKGFTLAELLIVVAIIAVLVAIAIPVFTSQLEKAREATDAANIRAKYAELMADQLSEKAAPAEGYKVTMTQKTQDWGDAALKDSLSKIMTLTGKPTNGKDATLTIDTDGKVTCTFAES